MRRTTVLWETWVNRFENAHARYRRRRLSAQEAGEMLGMSERHFRRLCHRYEDEGVAGRRGGIPGFPQFRWRRRSHLGLLCRSGRGRKSASRLLPPFIFELVTE